MDLKWKKDAGKPSNRWELATFFVSFRFLPEKKRDGRE
jgi:hypothetical protein